MLSAQRNIAFVAAEDNLSAGFNHLAARHARVADGLAAAPAHGLDLFKGVCPGQQPLASLKEIALKVRAQTIANDGNIQVIDDFHQLFHLSLAEKLRFIHDDAIIGGEI